MQWRLLAPRYWPTWAGIAVLRLLALLPYSWVIALGGLLGRVMRLAAPRFVRTARRNLELCFPELDAAQRHALMRRCFRSIGMGLFEFCRAWWGPLGLLPAQTRMDGVEHIEHELAKGRGVILLSGHFLTLELCGRLLCTRVPVAGMYRRHESPVFEWAVKRGRLRYAKAMFAREELRGAVKHLKAGGILWYAPDQDMRGKDAVFAPFFGIAASSITATHQLARLTGAAVVPFFHRREGDRYVLRIAAPLDDFPSVDAVADTARVNAAIETMVRAAPSQYLWLHKRFKRRPPGEPRLY